MSNEKKADALGLKRTTYEYRLKHWVQAEIDGRACLVSPKHYMLLDAPKAPEGDSKNQMDMLK